MQVVPKANDWDEFWRTYKEEPLLTLLATGLARHDKENEISILREYPVYLHGQYIGSSDLFLNYYKDKTHFFIESKYERARWETGFIEWSEENYQKFVKETEGQLTFYIEAEKQADIKSYSVILLFYMLDFKDQKSYFDYIIRSDNYNPQPGQFYEKIPLENPEKYHTIRMAF